MPEQVRCCDEAANHQLPYRFGLLNHPNSFCRGMFQLKATFDADSLLYLLSPFECDGHTVHMLTQCHLPPPMSSTVKSSLFTMRIPVHSPWLPGYNDVAQTILIILTMAGLFPDRPRIFLVRRQQKHDTAGVVRNLMRLLNV